MTDKVHFIDGAGALASLCADLRHSDYLAVDTEFVRERTFYPRLCLIQLATSEVTACIDPLQLDDLTPLLELLYDTSIVKVLHAAQQDLEIFHHLKGAVPGPIFDTQIAATLLGYGDQIGYAGLISTVLGKQLGKDQTRTDWARRPLSQAQLAYAADDVRYLSAAYPQIRDALDARGRLQWLRADFAALVDPARYTVDPDNAWRRVKGVAKLRGVRLAVAQALAAWRERAAIRADKPRRWMLADDMLVALAQQLPKSVDDLGRLRGLSEALLKREGNTLIKLIAESQAKPQSDWPSLERRAVLSAAQEALLDAMSAVIQLHSDQFQISPGALGGRQALVDLMVGNDNAALLQGWRFEVVGGALQSLLAGASCLRVEQGALKLREIETTRTGPGN